MAKKKLSLNDIFSVQRRSVVVDVPEWGGEVTVWEMTAEKSAEFEDGLAEATTDEKIAKLVRACMGDENGPFNPAADVAAITKLPTVALMRVYNAAADLNLLSKRSQEAALKNSDGEPQA